MEAKGYRPMKPRKDSVELRCEWHSVFFWTVFPYNTVGSFLSPWYSFLQQSTSHFHLYFPKKESMISCVAESTYCQKRGRFCRRFQKCIITFPLLRFARFNSRFAAEGGDFHLSLCGNSFVSPRTLFNFSKTHSANNNFPVKGARKRTKQPSCHEVIP